MNNPARKDEVPNIPTTPDDLLAIFDELNIEYELYHHPRVFTVAESQAVDQDIPGEHCRNLFLRDKKKRMFLVVLSNNTEVNLNELQEKLDCARLSFGSPDRLMEYLGIYPGAVCPFAAINDKGHAVSIVLDAHMMAQPRINFHPLDNAMTVGISPDDLLKFYTHTGHEPLTLSL